MSSQWSGSLQIGLTTMAISDTTSPAQVPPSADQITSKVTWVVTGSTVLKCGQVMRENYAPALERLQVRFCFVFSATALMLACLHTCLSADVFCSASMLVFACLAFVRTGLICIRTCLISDYAITNITKIIQIETELVFYQVVRPDIAVLVDLA